MSFKFKVFDKSTGDRLKGNRSKFTVMTDTGGFLEITSDGFYTYVGKLDMNKYKVELKENK